MHQRINDKSLRIGKAYSEESGVDLFISQAFDEFIAEGLLQRQRHARISLLKRANDPRYKWVKRARGRGPDADSALLASRRAPCRFACVVELHEHGAGIVEEGAPGLGQFDTTRLAAK